ncbi:MAG: RND transporter, partial [Aquincola sp.]|nr:RND transporter [Aquincola sp.]
MTMRHRSLSALAAAALLAGCASLAPPYAAPAAPLPDHYDTSPDAAPSPAAELAWQDYFTDATLRPLIDQALTQNHDLRLAVLWLQEAQALYGVQRSASLPTLALS